MAIVVNMNIPRLRKTISLKHFVHKREDFEARIEMEKYAQREVDARLTRMELVFKNKTRAGR